MGKEFRGQSRKQTVGSSNKSKRSAHSLKRLKLSFLDILCEDLWKKSKNTSKNTYTEWYTERLKERAKERQRASKWIDSVEVERFSDGLERSSQGQIILKYIFEVYIHHRSIYSLSKNGLMTQSSPVILADRSTDRSLASSLLIIFYHQNPRSSL